MSNGPVFNLTVADAHEFFANGVLVHNCDAAFWAWRDLRGPTRRAGLTARAVDPLTGGPPLVRSADNPWDVRPVETARKRRGGAKVRF